MIKNNLKKLRGNRTQAESAAALDMSQGVYSMMECAEQMEHGMIQTQTHRDMWQNNLVWWLCKAVKLLLEERIRERKEQ